MQKTNFTRQKVLIIIISALLIILVAVFFRIFLNASTKPQTEYVDESLEKTESASKKDSNDNNPFASLSEKVFVQHDKMNQDIYLLSSQGKTTTVYQIIDVKLTAGKQ